MIFYLENDDDDVFLLRRALRRTGYVDSLIHFYRLAELRRHLEANPATRPKMFLLDMKLDGETGLDALAWVKQHPELSRIPAFLFSSGTVTEEILASMQLDASAYIFKPQDFGALKEVAEFLATVAGLPRIEEKATLRESGIVSVQ